MVGGRVRCPGGLTDILYSTIGVKQGCPLSPTLFGLYIDEVVDYITQRGGGGISLSGTTVCVLLYADDIILVSDTQEGLQQHLLALDEFCAQKGLTVNLGKTKAMIFHTSAQVRQQTTFTLANGQVEIVGSYVYLGVTFTATQGRFSMTQAARDRLTRGYAALGALERQCHQAHFQEPRTKGWLFDTLVTPALMYSSSVWGPGLTDAIWNQIERPQVLMLAKMIRSKPSVPHDIVRAEFAAPPMVIEALFQTVTFLHRLRELPPERLTRRAFESSRQLAEEGHTGVWYTQVLEWFAQYHIDIDRLPPLQYDPDAPRRLSRTEKNRVLRQDLWQLYIQVTWSSPPQGLTTKMEYYRKSFLQLSKDGFIERPRYLDVYLPHASRVAIGQLRVSSHQLEIETGRAAQIPRLQRLCRLCHTGVEDEEHFVCTCSAYQSIREQYPSLFSTQPTLRQIMTTSDQRLLGRVILEFQRRREQLLETPVHSLRGGRQTHLTDFFLSQSPATITTLSRPTGVTTRRAEELRARRRPRLAGYHAPRLYHQEIAAIRARHEHEIQRRVDHLRSAPAGALQGVLTPPSQMYTLLNPTHDTGWH